MPFDGSTRLSLTNEATTQIVAVNRISKSPSCFLALLALVCFILATFCGDKSAGLTNGRPQMSGLSHWLLLCVMRVAACINVYTSAL